MQQTFLSLMGTEAMLSFPLSLLSHFYRAGVCARHYVYDHQLLPIHRLPACVVSVGNIAVGGTGKTPCVDLLARALSPHLPVAILSRGYRSRVEKQGAIARVQEESGAAERYGDEPLWLARHTAVPVWVGPD